MLSSKGLEGILVSPTEGSRFKSRMRDLSSISNTNAKIYLQDSLATNTLATVHLIVTKLGSEMHSHVMVMLRVT